MKRPISLAAVASEIGLEFEELAASEAEAVLEQIAAKTADLLVVFPADFDERVALVLGLGEEAAAAVTSIPEVELFYNSTRVESATSFYQMQ